MRRRLKDTPKPEEPSDTSPEKNEKHERQDSKNPWSPSGAALLAVIILGAAMVGLNMYELRTLRSEQLKALEKAADSQSTPAAPDNRPRVVVWSPRVNLKHLSHVFKVFERLGYRVVETNDTDWDVLWAHDYPFHVWQQALKSLRPNQKVNHFPGTGYVTTKVSLATSGGPHIPPAFRIPEDKDKLMDYAVLHPSSLFVEKKNDHRSVHLRGLDELDFTSTGSFVQEFMSKPLLISGHKFDIGVYTIITSVDPLRIYKFDGDVLFRFCLEPYEPFNGSNTAQYVIGEDYLPAWKVPALQQYSELAFSRREAFDAHRRSAGKDPAQLWEQIDSAISSVYLGKQKQFTDLLGRYKSRRSFFEMVRFDFIVDEDLVVYLLEANMSPNLSSMHYPPNALLYEQVLYNMLALVGVATYLHPPYQQSVETRDMVVAERNLMVLPEQCTKCEDCDDVACQLCRPCLRPDTLDDLKMAYREHLNRQRCKRVFPKPMTQSEASRGLTSEQLQLSTKDQLMVRWFQGKCLLDSSWCH